MDIFKKVFNDTIQAPSGPVIGFAANVHEHLVKIPNNVQLLADRVLTMGVTTAAVGFARVRQMIRNLDLEQLVSLLNRKDVQDTALASGTVFAVVLTSLLHLGFGTSGIAAGSLAAAFQSVAYAGFTPGTPAIFATLTSLGMSGMCVPVFAGVAVVLAVAAGWYVWELYESSRTAETHEHSE